MSKIKRFTRFIAVLLLTALSFGPAMAGTGGYGRRNINTTINQSVNTSQTINQTINQNWFYNVGNYNTAWYTANWSAEYCAYCNSQTYASGSSQGGVNFNYSQFVQDELYAVNALEHSYQITGNIPTASEFQAFFTPQNLLYYTGTQFSNETFTALESEGGSSLTESGIWGGMLEQAQADAAAGGGMSVTYGTDSNGNPTGQIGRWYQSYSTSPIQVIAGQEHFTSSEFNATHTTHYTISNLSTFNLENGKVTSLSGHIVGGRQVTIFVNTHNHVTQNTTLSGSMKGKATVSETLYQLNAQVTLSPIVLNMNGSGKLEASGGQWLPHPNHLSANHLVLFDLFGDGFPVIMEWVGPQDGLLIHLNSSQIRQYDMTGHVHITGNNLFGNVGGWVNGYEKLAAYDRNGNGKLTGSELKGFYVWQDKNGNAKVDPGELKSVQQLGITRIDVIPNHQLVSHFIMNGKRYKMWDWYPNVMEVEKIH